MRAGCSDEDEATDLAYSPPALLFSTYSTLLSAAKKLHARHPLRYSFSLPFSSFLLFFTLICCTFSHNYLLPGSVSYALLFAIFFRSRRSFTLSQTRPSSVRSGQVERPRGVQTTRTLGVSPNQICFETHPPPPSRQLLFDLLGPGLVIGKSGKLTLLASSLPISLFTRW